MKKVAGSDALERVLGFGLFALYLVTSIRLCRYSTWRRAGSPNPFLPPTMKVALAAYERQRVVLALT
ncbi:hypothetical protein EF888_06575 [Silicimonas algicola]|uniref:Uncharacterized protein n=1 Tax=Silicimonas algicola TaxID=1826607 RepID=A0A316G3U0_9RHOB|nr:hypothetical protein [Silicimonas algicola]AZQ66833.1 hypothetical protein EF888_06575 [Silicimonas algicola]PWK55262.1 hypothetical protein C8D95_108141 [Silicimonas algicola]